MDTQRSTPLEGVRARLVLNDSNASAWGRALATALEAAGAQVTVQGVTEAVARDARSLIGRGAGQLFQRLAARATQTETVGDDERELIVTDAPLGARALRAAQPGDRVALYGITTQLGDTDRWPDGVIDGLIVPTETVRDRVSPTDLEAEDAPLAGPPVDPRWLADIDPLREAITDDEAPIVLADVEGWGASDMAAVARAMSLFAGQLTPAFYVGPAPETRDQMRSVLVREGLEATIVRDVPHVERYLAAADLVVVRDEQHAVLRHVAMGRPVIVWASARRDWPSAIEMARDETGLALALERGLQGSRPTADGLRSRLGTQAIADAIIALWERPDVVADVPPPVEAARAPDAPGIERVRPKQTPVERREDQMRRMASLLRREKELERELVDLGKERDVWIRRAGLAADDGDDELRGYAEGRVTTLTQEISEGNDALVVIQRQKEALRKRAATAKQASKGSMEDRFKDLERRGGDEGDR